MWYFALFKRNLLYLYSSGFAPDMKIAQPKLANWFTGRDNGTVGAGEVITPAMINRREQLQFTKLIPAPHPEMEYFMSIITVQKMLSKRKAFIFSSGISPALPLIITVNLHFRNAKRMIGNFIRQNMFLATVTELTSSCT